MTLPTIAAAGSFALAKQHFAAMLSACASVQAVFGAANAAAALARIWIDELPRPAGERFTLAELTAQRPFLLIGHNPRAHYTARRLAYGDGLTDQGHLVAQLEVNASDLLESGDDAAEEGLVMRRMDNLLGAIVADLFGLSYQAGYLALDEIQLDGPWRTDLTDPEQQGLGDCLLAFFRVRWNGGGA